MIAADTSVLIDYFAKGSGADLDLLDRALAHGSLVLPPIVLSEVLCAKGMKAELRALLVALPRLPLSEGYWERAADLRSTLLAKRLKARLADTLISQSCIDHDVPLLTRDKDFRHFVRLGRLQLA